MQHARMYGERTKNKETFEREKLKRVSISFRWEGTFEDALVKYIAENIRDVAMGVYVRKREKMRNEEMGMIYVLGSR